MRDSVPPQRKKDCHALFFFVSGKVRQMEVSYFALLLKVEKGVRQGEFSVLWVIKVSSFVWSVF